MRRMLAAVAIVVALCSARATAEPLKVLTTGAFREIVTQVAAEHERATGERISVLGGTSGALQKRVAGGEAFDVLVLTPAAAQALEASGQVAAGSVIPLARTGMGVAVKAGAPLPDISTTDKFRQALLAARAVAYSDPAAGGSSGIYFDRLLERLGIADVVRAKGVRQASGYVAERLVTGEADLAVHQVSEILPVRGATLVGPLPEDIQNYTTYAIAVSASSANARAARAFAAAMTSPQAAQVMTRYGMSPPR